MTADLFRKQSTRSALTFRGFCTSCDAQLFHPIDQAIETVTPEIATLLAYRALSYSLWYGHVQEVGDDAMDELLGIPRAHPHSMVSTDASWRWQRNSKLMSAIELRYAIDTRAFAALRTRVLTLRGDDVDQLRFSCVVAGVTTLEEKRTPLKLRDCAVEASLYVHLLSLANGEIAFVVSAPRGQPRKTLDAFVKSAMRASKAGRLSSALMRFVMISNKGLVLSADFADRLPKTAVRNLETEVLTGGMCKSVRKTKDVYEGLPLWHAHEPTSGKVLEDPPPNGPQTELVRLALAFKGQECRPYLGRWLRAGSAYHIGHAGVGLGRTDWSRLMEASRSVAVSGPSPNHARLLTQIALSAASEDDKWLQQASSDLGAGVMHIGSMQDVRFGLAAVAARRLKALFDSLSTAVAEDVDLTAFVEMHRLKSLGPRYAAPASIQVDGDDRVSLMLAAQLDLARAEHFRATQSVWECLEAARSCIDICETIGLDFEPARLIHAEVVVSGLWAQHARTDWDEQLPSRVRALGRMMTRSQAQDIAVEADEISVNLYGPRLAGSYTD